MSRRKNARAPGCPYCGTPSKLVSSETVYGRGRNFGPLWACLPCSAWVSCHKGTTRPKGRLANYDLRQAKIQAHAAFDPIWKIGTMGRSEAYAWLAEHMGVAGEDCHIGMFDLDQCQRVIMICDWWRDGRRGAA